MSIKVLIIDDAIHIRRVIARMLQRSDIATLEAANGQQGLQIMKAEKPDVVTCDIAMPLMDGYEFLKTAKADPEISEIPVVVITAIGEEKETAKATQMGADACITKPFSSGHLLEIINFQLAKRNKNIYPQK